MQIRLVRHATLLIEMAGRRILVDPMLSEVGAMDPVANATNSTRIPMLPLPMPVADILDSVDSLLITHLHRDHLDDAAVAVLPKTLPLLCQPGDAERLSERGFQNLLTVPDVIEHAGIEFIRTGGTHGTGLIGKAMGSVSGFVLRAPGEPTLYIAGDTVWCGAVRDSLETFRPEVVVVNAGAAQYRVGTPITMDGLDIARVCATAPDATVVAVHMDTINHCLLTRDRLRTDLAGRGLYSRVSIPADGEILSFPGSLQ